MWEYYIRMNIRFSGTLLEDKKFLVRKLHSKVVQIKLCPFILQDDVCSSTTRGGGISCPKADKEKARKLTNITKWSWCSFVNLLICLSIDTVNLLVWGKIAIDYELSRTHDCR